MFFINFVVVLALLTLLEGAAVREVRDYYTISVIIKFFQPNLVLSFRVYGFILICEKKKREV